MTAETLCFERLRVIRDDVPRDGALNMALDETLLHDSGDTPTLRFYRWTRQTVSFGYFEPVGTARRIAGERNIVRRLTGGGIVEHGDDLTFTLVVPRTDAFARVRPAESYRQIHAALARALTRGGFVSRTHEDNPSQPSDDPRPNACFDRPVLHDLMADGRKVAGGAQRRHRNGLLHQGSVRLGFVSDHGWEDDLRRELPPALARVCETRIFTAAEITRAELLAAAKYATPAWTDRV